MTLSQSLVDLIDFLLEKTLLPLFSLARSLSLSLFYFSNYQETINYLNCHNPTNIKAITFFH
jgi:hypothetical protein